MGMDVAGYHDLFFFSSRRRHTRWPRDWSSDVCSSDLTVIGWPAPNKQNTGAIHGAAIGTEEITATKQQIGRASCRERAESAARGGSIETKKERTTGRTAKEGHREEHGNVRGMTETQST